MPTQLPSSFASAAAGQTTRGDARSGARGDSVRGAGSGEWARSNGTRTFRRSSTTPFNNQSVAASNSTDATQNPALDSHNSINNNNASSASQPALTASDQQQHQQQQQNNQHNQGPLRYSKDELYEIYKHSAEAANNIDMSSLFAPSWNPTQTNGTASRVWGKTSDSPHVPQDPTVCWDPNGTVKPIGLEPMSAEEREMFATDVNSTLKPPQIQQQNKEGGVQGGIQNGGRKTSVSVNTSNFSSTASPATASRPATRRRETADTNPFPSSAVASPTTAGRFPRDDPWLPRRNTDLRESITDEPAEENPPTTSRTQPFGLTRSNTAGSSAFGSSASLWGPAATTPGAGIGAFGSFALNTATSTIGEKRFGGTGGSRLAHLIPKDSNENVAANKGNESAPGTDTNRGWRPRQRTDTDPFGPDDSLTGSAILGGAQDNSPPASSLQRSGVFDTPVKGSSGDFGMSALNLGGNNNQNEQQGNGPASPSETNPYRSPLAERGDEGHDDAEIDRLTHNAAGSEPQSNFSTLSRAFGGAPFDGSDRSQTSSVGAKGFPTVNTLGGWPTAPSVGTPDRERQPFNSAFGTSIFSPIGDLQSPGFGGLGGFGVAGGSGLGRANKLSSLFPPAMQAQMGHVGHEQENLSDSVPDLRQANPLGAIGRGAIGTQPRDAASPMRAGRGAFEDLFPGADAMKSPFTSGEHQAGLTSTAPSSGFPATTAGPAFSATPTPGEPNQQQQQRTMVMPDRMRWVYLDPQGQMQGPFSGLEMNDWYKANFFSPDLRVKRVEDPDFEPLGQLIRRIGNSREPFLVPQMGIPHGPPPSAGPFALGAAEAIPPLQGAFPSFGRTLTAAQQNDLERRKQEEQLYHARQREFLHHHQSFGRLPLQPGIPGALHHHSSAHSLQSQPSFGSITSPIGMPQPPIGAIGPNSGFFEAPVSLGQAPTQQGLGPDLFAPDLNLGERQLLANLQANGGLPGSFPTQPIGAPIGDNSSLRSNLPSVDQLRNDEQGFNAKLKEFHELRAQHDAEEAAAHASVAAAQEVLQEVKEEAPKSKDEPKAAPASGQETVKASKKQTQEPKEAAAAAAKEMASQAEVSLTEKIKKTQAENNAAKLAQQAAASGLPMPFPPPPQANTPLAAPTAQRPASGLPARYGERSGSGTPDTTSDAASLAPPPTAPWAGTETQKGPSLKEIQEAEAKKAAKKEEAAAAARRAALEQEAAALREREKAAAAAHIGLPATSTWGTGSPVGAPASGSPWKQPAAKVATTTTGSKKTLAEIQREEELRKQKAKEAAVQASIISGSGLGKRYADLASKTSSTSAPPGMITPGAAAQAAAAAAATVGGGWSTVGAGGKVKMPTGPAATSRPVSTTPVKTTVLPAAKVVAKPATAALKDAKNVALEEFKKWLHRELSKGLSGVNDIESFASTLLELPLDVAILSECVYGFSTTMDGRHFAEEFVRRRKLADKGIVEKDSNTGAMSSSNGGWSEVAKKGGNSAQAAAVKEEPMAAVPGFRVVQAKKGKGKK
ncbi:hypothetical protein SMACR_07280 [Sordaria macrospora]|uniref:WGS project CABT00000000 data, contig 2.44 n=2 Tax=Sordaria macrospora TaxID=5147 RepID=F7W8C6_SORMK|nr:uncharacterized protein SMAC_07280 [Sordaria macrospora k-hell]KAA8630317.1 hypothetical protein SMACR_07280 [Sordaria macrospora]KAH7625326.1 hypothetical protein B0T09DRAFT_351683 [Sordaria sp. MPI-SDFR-AT-0083]WPJ62684.1 hypothetical protein SMAC4_07280 [Sordaria macrospora]CCC13771.1 unnamed protein product [Sordaria macrospora k-hell]